MTQPQAQQAKRLGHHPEFNTFLDSLVNMPEEKHEEAWLKMYKDLLPKKYCSETK